MPNSDNKLTRAKDRRLKQRVSGFDTEPTVVLELSTGTKPVLFKCGDQCSYLLMPITG